MNRFLLFFLLIGLIAIIMPRVLKTFDCVNVNRPFNVTRMCIEGLK
jgi:hypothetical protein